ncbi:endolytic transglycosylase MltG [Anaerolentibacter hominis]|uniref:endolytic transglycosylase MltG n=1 Tax=Anaerolentibacter hominis TaxID=3079009 RepID=UPI0031B8652A
MSKKKSTTKVALKMTGGAVNMLLTIAFYILVIMVICKIGAMSYEFAYEIFGDVSVDAEPGRDVEITINEGDSAMNIAGKLEVNKVVVNKYSFYIRIKLNRKNLVKPGTYTLNSSMNYDEIMRVITGQAEPAEEKK